MRWRAAAVVLFALAVGWAAWWSGSPVAAGACAPAFTAGLAFVKSLDCGVRA